MTYFDIHYHLVVLFIGSLSAADLWDLRNGCLDAWMLGCLSNELFGTPVGAAAPVSGPGLGGGGSGSDLLWQPVAGCGGLWRAVAD